MLGTLAILISWVMEILHVTIYGNEVKPAVKYQSWIHDIGMRQKSICSVPAISFNVCCFGNKGLCERLRKVRKVLMWTSLSIFLISVIIATEGFWITNAANTVLGVAR